MKKVLIRVAKIIGCIIVFLIIALTNGNERNVTKIESFLSDIINVPQKSAYFISKQLSSDETFFKTEEELKKAIENLEKENEELKSKMINYDLINNSLNYYKSKEKLDKNYKDFEIVVAEVISESNNNLDEIYVINKGSKAGIKPKMVVITSDGLVGYVYSCDENTSKVISILDGGNKISARNARTRDEVTLKGTLSLKDKGELKLDNINIEMDFKSGDEFITSGIGGLYPKGIRIGKINSINQKLNPLESDITIKTNVDFNKLETVAVIID